MRALTNRQMGQFDSAFDFIDRVGCLHCEGENVNLFDIMVDDKRLPNKLIAFISSEYNSNLKLLNQDFNDFMRKKNIGKLIKYCYDNNVQPYELWEQGMLSIKESPKTTYEYEYVC